MNGSLIQITGPRHLRLTMMRATKVAKELMPAKEELMPAKEEVMPPRAKVPKAPAART